MKYQLIRTFMKHRNLSRLCTFIKKKLIIDGSCFKQMYRNSGCSFILGGEYDRFASYLRDILSCYIESNIKCYVIFNGATNNLFDIEKQKLIHQGIITRLDGIKLDGDNEYFEPLFTNDVCIEVLKELGIQYYICMNNFREILLCSARNLKCPIVSNNVEYALYGVSVIPFKSVVYNPIKKCITCSIYYEMICRWAVRKKLSDDMMSLVLTMSDEDSDFYNELLTMFQCIPEQYIRIILRWIRCQTKDSAFTYIINNLQENNRQVFLDTFEQLRNLFACTLDSTSTMPYLLNFRNVQSNETWIEHAVGIGRIAYLFINLKLFKIISGSSLMYHETREDAILPAIDIALYGLSLLTETRDVDISLIGRKNSACVVSKIHKTMNIPRVNKLKLNYRLNFENNIQNFLSDQLPGFDMTILETAPEDCWILLITLLYYSRKTGRNFTKEAYCFILSYVLLSPVSEKVGLINRSNLTINHGGAKSNKGKNDLTHEQCSQAANAVIDLFCLSASGLKNVFDRDILHTFAEFQHCLHFMNNLNKLCGEKIKCTTYHKTINCTFIYKLFTILKDKSSPGAYIEKILKCPPVYSYFKNILRTYYQALALLILYEI